MEWVRSIQQAIDYMEAHLMEDVSVEEVAKQIHVSAFHFQRLFTVLTNVPVGEYMRGRRLTLAAQELMTTQEKVIDIAYKYGYETPEAFTKAFRRQHGITPSEARKRQGGLKSINRLTIQVRLKGAEPMTYRITEKEAFKALGMKRTYALEGEENLQGIPQFWLEANRDGTSDRLAQLNTGELKGLLGICIDNRDGTMDYWIAADSKDNVSERFSAVTIPAAKWGVFEVHGAMPEAMQNVWKHIFSEWFPSNNYEYAETPEMEVYPLGNAYSPNYYSEIWVPLK